MFFIIKINAVATNAIKIPIIITYASEPIEIPPVCLVFYKKRLPFFTEYVNLYGRLKNFAVFLRNLLKSTDNKMMFIYRKYRKFKKFFCFSFLIFAFSVFAQNDDFLQGENLFKENRVEEAVPFLKSAISTGKFPKAYNYLALCYEKMGLLKESLEVCTEGMKISGTDKKVLAFNAGNVCFAMEDFYSAEKWYSLAIAANRLYAPPVLNRANAELKQEKYIASLEDYKLYLDLSPNDRQKPEIEQLISLLEGFKKAEEDRLAEEKRLKEEAALIHAAQEQQIFAEQQAAAQKQIQDGKDTAAEWEAKMAEQQALLEQQRAEIERISKEKQLVEEQAAAEKKARDEDKAAELEAKMAEQEARLEQQRAEIERMLQEQKAYQEAALKAQREESAKKAEEDAARRRKLLEDVAASLQNSETSNMTAGAEGTVDYGYESELE